MRIFKQIALICLTNLYDTICIDKSSKLRIIVTSSQRIQSCLRIIAIPSVAIGVFHSHHTCERTGRGQRLSPGVVGVFHNNITTRVVQPNDVPLAVVQVVVLRAVRLVRNPTVSVGPFSSISFYNTSALLALLSEQYRP